MPATTRTWSASGTWARRPTRSRPRAASSATSRCWTGRAATGTWTNFSALIAKAGVHGGRPIPDGTAEGLLRDEDVHRQADQLHRREQGRRQAVLRVRRPPGPARSLPAPEGVARPARRAVRQGLGCPEEGAAQSAGRTRHRAEGDQPRGTDVVPSRPDRPGSCGQGRLRQEDGALRRHGGEHGLPRRAAHRAPEGDRRVREHDFHRLRRQRRRGDRPLRHARRLGGDARLPVRGIEVVQDRYEVVGRSGLVSRPTARPGPRSP